MELTFLSEGDHEQTEDKCMERKEGDRRCWKLGVVIILDQVSPADV